MYYKTFIINMTLLLACGCSNPVDKETKAGIYQMNKEDYDQAVEHFTSAIEEDRFWLPGYYNRAIAESYRNNYQAALNDLTFVITSDPFFGLSYLNRAIIYENLKDYPNAIKDYSSCISNNPKQINAYHYRGRILFKMGNYDGALADFNQAIELGKNLALPKQEATTVGLNATALYFNRALTLQAKDLHKEAIEDYSTLIKLDPSLALAFYNRAISYIEMQMTESAAKDLAIAKNLGLHKADILLDSIRQ